MTTDDKTIVVTGCFCGCPVCGGNDGMVNAGIGNFSYCRKHEVSWFEGIGWYNDYLSEAEQENVYEATIGGFTRIDNALHPGVWSVNQKIGEQVWIGEEPAHANGL